MKNLKIVYLPVDSLKPYEKNARKHNERNIAAIKASITEFGMNDPIGVWGENNIIVEGHGRVIACKELGMTEVPCIRLDYLTEEERRAYTLAHNKTAEIADWDWDFLKIELNDIVSLDMTDFGFTELDILKSEDVVREDKTDKSELPEEEKAVLQEYADRANANNLAKKVLYISYYESETEALKQLLGVKDELRVTYNADYLIKNRANIEQADTAAGDNSELFNVEKVSKAESEAVANSLMQKYTGQE